MGSGEADIRLVKVEPYVETKPEYKFLDLNGTSTVSNWHICDGFCNHGTTSYYSTTWSNTIYMYQITCPKRSCKTINWMQLDTITPCKACGSKIKAVSNKADYEVAVN